MIRIADRAVHPVAVLATVAGAIGLLVAAPRLLLIMLVGAAAIVGVVLAVELAPSSRAIVWNDFRRSSSERQASDRRVQVLKARLGRTSRASSVAAGSDDADDDELGDALVHVIDDLLLDQHGVDRAGDPQAAGRILGPELARFVDDPLVRRSMVRRRSLAATLTLIEAL